MFFKTGVLRNFPIFTGKHLCWSLFLIKLQALQTATLLKRDFNTSVFLWILRNFCEQLFYRAPTVESVDLLFLAKNNVGWFLLKRFVYLVRVGYLPIISKNYSNTFIDSPAENKNLSKVKHCNKGYCSDIRILTV